MFKRKPVFRKTAYAKSKRVWKCSVQGFQAFKSLPVKVAAKTGTAESKAKVSGKIVTGLNGFMISFAPADDPQIAVCVAIENLNSGSATASLVAEIYKAYFETDGGSVNTAQGYGSLLG